MQCQYTVKTLNRPIFRGDTHMTSTLRGWWRVREKGDVIGGRGWGVNECSGRPIFFLLKKIGFAP